MQFFQIRKSWWRKWGRVGRKGVAGVAIDPRVVRIKKVARV
jgi:hypothetical protein